ncbi:FAD/NAD(P)-binding domain-containing protein [Cucurbitaria berberidis CBS 394.84]|uniref:FAD/NAD(P)-binding domain-containing protein n=1 Tax=Cucurbitaria berberidis CBS 394.84 TaxID=1168544 RepID=A0A9P4GCS1_9PLEO|nr:FAD/NAD(P)-binding domain-containing protein [Cucurbitaria berberidis CBS 394.84]KAF1842815.1 FAD/NAD(P)-binding domain-containing protein [Cucurbitaria berberidis CBS 394.84]
MASDKPQVIQKQQRDASSKLDVIIVGAGLGGLGAGISILLAGHNVHILESTAEIGEIGAGIQCLPNASRVLISWGLEGYLSQHSTAPRLCNMIGWKGNKLSDMDFHEYAEQCGTPFWDFHRANLHMGLLERAIELGATLTVKKRVDNIEYETGAHGDSTTAIAVCADGTRYKADLIVGADGINSKCREILLGHEDPPLLTGDLAYRLLLNTQDMIKDPELKSMIEDPQVNYWIGPDAHAVNYVLRGGKLFNMVLLVPDDMPAGANTLAGNVEEMRALYKDWDPRIPKLLNLCQSVAKWRLMIRPGLDPTWSHESAAFTILGDAAHATLPYLASGAGMSLEDGHVLGLCLARLTSKSTAEKKKVLEVYERCRRERTERVVSRGNRQQYLYHVHDGPEQQERDRQLKEFGAFNGKGKVGKAQYEAAGLRVEEDPLAWRWGGVGSWLITYICEEDVERRWREVEAEAKSAGYRDSKESVRAVL